MKLVFYADGGTIGRNGKEDCIGVYYSVLWEKSKEKREGKDFYHVTNNAAELMALCSALEWSLEILDSSVPIPDQILQMDSDWDNPSVIINMDSKWAIGMITQNWRLKALHLEELVKKARALMNQITLTGTNVSVLWVPREENVKRLGH